MQAEAGVSLLGKSKRSARQRNAGRAFASIAEAFSSAADPAGKNPGGILPYCEGHSRRVHIPMTLLKQQQRTRSSEQFVSLNEEKITIQNMKTGGILLDLIWPESLTNFVIKI